MAIQTQRKEVNLNTIANVLTIDEWFDKFKFAELIGAADASGINVRLRNLMKDKFLESKQGSARKLLYRMTAEMRLLMIERAIFNKKNRGRPHNAKSKDESRVERKALAIKARKNREQAEDILRKAGLM